MKKRIEGGSANEVEISFSGTTATASVAATSGVSELTGDFGREDLNALRDKVNEIVRVINSL